MSRAPSKRFILGVIGAGIFAALFAVLYFAYKPVTRTTERIAVAYHGFLLDNDLNVLTDVSTAEADAFYQKQGWLGNQSATPLARAPTTTYEQECEKNGVPIPPPWGDPKWEKAGALPRDKIFAAKTLPDVEVWMFKTPLGICYALPRKDASGVIQALGIICQGEESSKACFWDNIRADGTKITGDQTKGMKPSDMQGGDKLKENCTNCHRGSNAFVIHPSTPLQPKPTDPTAANDPGDQTGRPTMPKREPYEPIGQPGWKNEPLEYALEPDGCAFCHAMPKLTGSYCRILKDVVGKTMPPPDGKKLDASHNKDLKKLKDQCNKIDPGLKW